MELVKECDVFGKTKREACKILNGSVQYRTTDTGQDFVTLVCTATENWAAHSSPSSVLGITRPQVSQSCLLKSS